MKLSQSGNWIFWRPVTSDKNFWYQSILFVIFLSGTFNLKPSTVGFRRQMRIYSYLYMYSQNANVEEDTHNRV
jgi:hypothetical protein